MIPVKLLLANCKDKTFTGELSDLRGHQVGSTLTLVSDLGNTAEFVRSEIQHDEEGDLVCYIYTASEESLRQNPRLQGWSITLFND